MLHASYLSFDEAEAIASHGGKHLGLGNGGHEFTPQPRPSPAADSADRMRRSVTLPNLLNPTGAGQAHRKATRTMWQVPDVVPLYATPGRTRK